MSSMALRYASQAVGQEGRRRSPTGKVRQEHHFCLFCDTSLEGDELKIGLCSRCEERLREKNRIIELIYDEILPLGHIGRLKLDRIAQENVNKAMNPGGVVPIFVVRAMIGRNLVIPSGTGFSVNGDSMELTCGNCGTTFHSGSGKVRCPVCRRKMKVAETEGTKA